MTKFLAGYSLLNVLTITMAPSLLRMLRFFSRRFPPFLLTLLALTAHAQTQTAMVSAGAFSTGSLAGWEEKSFKGRTRYELVQDSGSGKTVLQARTEGAASGLFRKMPVDLTKTPVLNWSWRIDQPYPGNNETAKGGDDFPVRVYVVVERGFLGLSTRAVNYVWSSVLAVGKSWPNPFTSQAYMIAVDSGTGQAGKWVAHSRNVRDDLKAAFGEDITEIHAIAVMTDGDNGGRDARAWYGDIFFSAR